MKFEVSSTSRSTFNPPQIIEFSTLEQFIDWVSRQKYEIIISNYKDYYYLEIYDSYRE